MSRQSLLDHYFKSKTKHIKCSKSIMDNDDVNKLKRKLSPTNGESDHLPKTFKTQVNEDEPIILSSDSDSEGCASKSPKREHKESDSDSDATLVLTPELLNITQNVSTHQATTPQTPAKSQTPHQLTRSTPKTESKENSTFLQSRQETTLHPSKTTFFSPSKNRIVNIRTPKMVIRNLNNELSPTLYNNESTGSNKSCVYMNDKTTFLTSIVHKYLNEPPLKHLLSCESQELLAHYLDLTDPGKNLVCRLFWRKERWYKPEELNDISTGEKKNKILLDDEALKNMLDELQKNKFIIKGEENCMSFEELAAILGKPDLLEICKTLKLKKISSKQDAVVALSAYCNQKSNITKHLIGHTSSNLSRVVKMMSVKAGSMLYQMSDLAQKTLHRLHILMYLGVPYSLIREKKLELALIYDSSRREPFPVDKRMELDKASLVFRNHEEFEKYVQAHDLFEAYTFCVSDNYNKCNIVKEVFNMFKNMDPDEKERYNSLPTWLRRFTPGYQHVKILESGIQDLKRDKTDEHTLLALDILSALIKQPIFRQHNKAEWYAEKALILCTTLRRWDEAAEVLVEGLAGVPGAPSLLRARARRLAPSKALAPGARARLLQAAPPAPHEADFAGDHVFKQPMDRRTNRGKVKFETRTSEGRSVQEAEDYCIGHYISIGEFTDGEHWEGRIINTIFFLLFWDIIYTKPANVQGVFISYYQKYPLDMFTDSFYENRKTAIDEQLSFIKNASVDTLLGIMKSVWNARPENEQSGISRVGWEKLSLVTRYLGARGVTALCTRLATDYRRAHAGFPDLTLWDTRRNKIKFVEVKTDSDKPSLKQLEWMTYLREHDIDTTFCYVGADTMRQRCRLENTTKRETKKKPTKKQSLKKKPNKTETPKKSAKKVTKKQAEKNKRPSTNSKAENESGDDASEFQESKFIKDETETNTVQDGLIDQSDSPVKQESVPTHIKNETNTVQNGQKIVQSDSRVKHENDSGSDPDVSSTQPPRLQDTIIYEDSPDLTLLGTSDPTTQSSPQNTMIEFENSEDCSEEPTKPDKAYPETSNQVNNAHSTHDDVIFVPQNPEIIELD